MKLNDFMQKVQDVVGVDLAEEMSEETEEESLYAELAKLRLFKAHELGEGMCVINQLINGWWKPRYIMNHNTKTAFRFMNRALSLMTVTKDDIEWRTLKALPTGIQNRARALSAEYLTTVEDFRNGVALVRWQINPAGCIWMDDGGFGTMSDDAVELCGYIDKSGKVVGKFRLLSEDDKDVDYRKSAEANLLKNK